MKDEPVKESNMRKAGARRVQGLAIIEQPKQADGSPEAAPASKPLSNQVTRRGFAQVVGTGMAVSGMAACYRPRNKVVPYVKRPPEVTPGNPNLYATAIPHEGYGFGVLVESHEGRPTKIEGNPDHPDSGGRTNGRDQAYIAGLYDVDRARELRHEGRPLSWKSLAGILDDRAKALDETGGAGLRFLVEPSTSPLLADLQSRVLKRFPKAKFVAFSSIADDGVTAGSELAFGKPLQPLHNLSEARVILALDSDFIDDGPEAVRLQGEFAKGREPGSKMNRLYVVEPFVTSTGVMADHRLRVRGSDVAAVARMLVAELQGVLGSSVLAPLKSLASSSDAGGINAAWVKAVAKDLAKNRGRSLVIAGRRQPAEVHALAQAVNYALGNVGTTVSFVEPLRNSAPIGAAALSELAQEIDSGAVDTLVITANNPVYGAPADLNFGSLLQKVPSCIYASLYEDETAKFCKSFVPVAHSLETWADLRGTDGTVSLVQPLIDPLWSSLSDVDVLGAFIGDAFVGAHEQLKRFWKAESAKLGVVGPLGGFDAYWDHWLARGVIEGTAVETVKSLSLNGSLASALTGTKVPSSQGGLEVVFAADVKVLDGRFANNPWLQELPHPATKVTWDNAVLLSMATARKLGLERGDIVDVSVGERTVSGPVYVQPGQADDTVTLPLGYGRTGAETVAKGVGFNAGVIRESGAPWFAAGAKLQKTDDGYEFGITQQHWADEGREPVKVGLLEEVTNHHSHFMEELSHERGVNKWQIHEPVDYSKDSVEYAWGMSIDLNKCSGCGACVIACQSENNIPVVGREHVRIGREMHWIRIDRYYEDAPGYGDDKDKLFDDTYTVVQPQMCVHCETAPCEYVCPVNATVHSDEGLNEMVYNRCVGTRYCSNNCPYKARHFNFLDWHGDPEEVETLKHNPDVTMRSRGVMEKCTYCVQRIERTRIDARVEGRPIRDGEVVTACQQMCPAGAIEFGSVNDPDTAVSKKHADPRRYDLLFELNTRPRTVYLARVRNPNPELA